MAYPSSKIKQRRIKKKRTSYFKKAIESVLQRRVKHIGDNEQTYTGYPAQLIKEIMARKDELVRIDRTAYKTDWIRKYRARLKRKKAL